MTEPDDQDEPADDEPPAQTWKIKLAGPARRALEEGLPETVAWAAYTFTTERLPANPYRLGGELEGPYAGMHSAQLGTYRASTGSTRPPAPSSFSPSAYAEMSTASGEDADSRAKCVK